MSLLPATSHANPTTPFWAVAGSGGGGTTGPLIRVPDANPTTTTPISYNQTTPLYDFVIPNEIAVGDVFVFQATFQPNDYDYNAGDPALAPYGSLFYKLSYEIDANPNAFLNLNSVNTMYRAETSLQIQPTTITFVGYKNDNFAPISLTIGNLMYGLELYYYNLVISNISFTKIGTGYVPLPP